MIKVLFKNVGQGDSILIEWKIDDDLHYGIIDCNIYNGQNPLLDELKIRGARFIDFIILSHLHFDHYSGLADLLNHCISNSIKIKHFLHTFTTDFTRILDLQFFSQRQQEITYILLQNIETALKNGLFDNFDNVSNNYNPISLNNSVVLSFLAPLGEDYLKLSRQRSAYENNRSTTVPDINTMSTIISISDGDVNILLTSDATKKAFKRLLNKPNKTITKLVQVPHHGSVNNLFEPFWVNIKKEIDCPAVYSVGDVKKDKLPNKNVVAFFEENGYSNMSTNYVYGLEEYYSGYNEDIKKVGLALSPFSKIRNTSSPLPIQDRFNGDKEFNIRIT